MVEEDNLWLSQKALGDLFATSLDYDPSCQATKLFFQTVQNKLHYAISGNTAPEIIRSRPDAEKDNMGLKTWHNAPSGRIHRSDVAVAKNYLEKDERLREAARPLAPFQRERGA